MRQTINQLAGQTQNFSYDALDRLTAAAATGGSAGVCSESYGYAPTGNLTSKAGAAYTYADAAHVHAAMRNGRRAQLPADRSPRQHGGHDGCCRREDRRTALPAVRRDPHHLGRHPHRPPFHRPAALCYTGAGLLRRPLVRPRVGRFISADTIVPQPGNPQAPSTNKATNTRMVAARAKHSCIRDPHSWTAAPTPSSPTLATHRR